MLDKLITAETFPFWATIVFVITLFLLSKFAWKPILTAIKEREDSINNALDAAENARKEMEQLKGDNEALLAAARAERDAILKEARDMKENIINQAKEEAQVQREKIITQAKTAIENEKQQAISDLKNQVATLSLQIARKVVASELSEKQKQEALIDNLLKNVTLK